MKREGVAEICRLISHAYNNVTFSKEKLETWYHVLKKFDFEEIRVNTIRHVTTQEFPPSISQILNPQKEKGTVRNVARQSFEDIQKEAERDAEMLKRLDNQ